MTASFAALHESAYDPKRTSAMLRRNFSLKPHSADRKSLV
jgi:hypothetical protein